MRPLVGFLVGLIIGLRWDATTRRILELLFIRRCQERFSLCLDCDLHNRCSRYSRHLHPRKANMKPSFGESSSRKAPATGSLSKGE